MSSAPHLTPENLFSDVLKKFLIFLYLSAGEFNLYKAVELLKKQGISLQKIFFRNNFYKAHTLAKFDGKHEFNLIWELEIMFSRYLID